MPQVWDKAAIHALLDSKPAAVTRALLAIYALQTDEEKAAKATRNNNGVGFSAYDAEFLTDIALKVKRGYTLSKGQLDATRNKMKRYHRQLAEIANAKQARQATSDPVLTPTLNVIPESAAATKWCTCEWSDGEPNVPCRGDRVCQGVQGSW